MLIEFVGDKNPWADLPGFIDRAKRTHPHATNTPLKLSQYVQRATTLREQRAPWVAHVQFGEDILSNDYESLPIYQHLTAQQISNLLAWPKDRRRELVIIPGLMHSYLWSHATEWLQDMTEHDARALSRHPIHRYFSIPERVGYHVDVRSYDGNGIDEFEQQPIQKSPNVDYADELDRVIADREIHGYVPGASLDAHAQE